MPAAHAAAMQQPARAAAPRRPSPAAMPAGTNIPAAQILFVLCAALVCCPACCLGLDPCGDIWCDTHKIATAYHAQHLII